MTNYYTPGRIVAARTRHVVKAHQQWSRGGTVPIEESIASRVEQLGQMNDQRSRLKACGDRDGLLKLAEAYRMFACGMPDTAAAVRKEAMKL
jgi:hypothetical protein